MKKIAFSICLTLLFASFSVAQDQATITPPAAPSPDVTPVADVVEAVAAEVARPSEEPVAQAAAEVVAPEPVAVDATPVEVPTTTPTEVVLEQGSVLEQGTVLEQGSVLEQGVIIESAPIYAEGQIIEGEVYNQDVVASSCCGSAINPVVSYDQGIVAEPAPAPIAFEAPVAVEASPVVSADPFAVPSTEPSLVAATPEAAPACVQCDQCNECETNSRRGIFRTVTTRNRSVFTRLRGLLGRRR